MPSKVISEDLKQEIIRYYLSYPMTIANVGKQFGLSNPTIIKILKDIPKYPRAKINSPYLNEHFFNPLTHESAYFLGLIIADGNVFHYNAGGRQDSISITLNEEDKYLLECFKQCIRCTTHISSDNRGANYIAVRSNIMSEDLKRYGVVPRKSYKTYLPQNIQDDLMPDVIRGIFDGDGSIQAKKNSDNRFLHNFSFCGTHRLMEDISDYIFNKLHLTQKPIVYDYKDRALSEIKIQNKEDMLAFGEWIYLDNCIFMKRKKNKYLLFKKYYGYGNTEVTE